ncbi:hypothetical protein BH11MYX1_BH11MYX1_16100 [soil metagenome]
MRVLGIVVMIALASAGSALAEKVKANQEARVLNHPGEQGKLVVKVKEGQSMTLLGSEGRWLKVRVQGRTGWVPRSKVEMADPDEVARNTRRRPFVDGRSTKRGFGSSEAPEDRIGADAVDTTPGDEGPSSGGSSADPDDKPEKKTTKPVQVAKSGAKPATSDDDDEEDKPTAKKPVKPVKLAAKPAKGSAGDDDDDEEDKPAKKPVTKPVTKPAKSPTSADEEDDEKPATKPTKTTKTTKPTKVAIKGDDDEEDAKPAKGAKPSVKHDDAENPVTGDDGDAKRPKAHVAAKSKVFGERDPASDVEFTAKPGDVLYPGETKGNWTKVETEEGDEGWILSDNLEVDGGSGGGRKRRAIGINVGLGVGYLSQAMTTTGVAAAPTTDQVPDVYSIGTSIETLNLGGSYFTSLGKYIAGVDGGLAYSKTISGGVSYKGVITPLTIADYTLRGTIGYPTSRPSGLTLLARLGYRYRAYMVSNYQDYTTMTSKNPAKVPQEVLKAPTIGFAIAMPKLTQKLGLIVGLDAIAFGGSVAQTEGLEDGKGGAASVTVINFSAGLAYAWKPQLDLVFAYDLDHGSYDFGKPSDATMSMRGHAMTATDVTRGDTMHQFSVTVAKGF